VTEQLCGAVDRNSLPMLGVSGRSCAYQRLLGDVTVDVLRNAAGPLLLSAKADSSA
jgi:hypothetical protein